MFRSKAGLADQRLCYANDSVRYEIVNRAMVTKVKRGLVMLETSEQKPNKSPSTSGCATKAKVGNKSQRQHKFANAEAVFESCINLANDKSWPPHLSCVACMLNSTNVRSTDLKSRKSLFSDFEYRET
jgi:hypothetical protein